jgi:hypothetical protein
MPTTELKSHTVVDKRAKVKPCAERFMGGYWLAECRGVARRAKGVQSEAN